MHKLTQFRLCPHSRSIRLALGELAIDFELTEENPWEWRPAFLAINPAGHLPVLALAGGPILCGAYSISEFISEEVRQHPRDGGPVPMFPGNREERSEVRRLVDWFHDKMNHEVTHELVARKVYDRLRTDQTLPPPDAEMMRAIGANLRYHLSYVNFLTGQRRWLAGDEMSFADLAAAAHFSVLDYLGELHWDSAPDAKSWFQRLKSRKSFRPLLADRIPGMPPPLAYSDLDF